MSEFEMDLADVMGSFIETELNCFEKQNQEIEQLQQENQKLKDALERSYTLEQLDFAVNEVKEELKVEKDINNNLHKTIYELRVNLYGTQQQLDLCKKVIEEVKEFVGSEEMYNCSFEEETNKLLQILDKTNKN